ncbi:MAG TPA: DUF6510 family protein [Actinomycetota bacterium]|jgi:hypothetical protein|nr:DUF6510 family protein [Actinomycetota bacterium]
MESQAMRVDGNALAGTLGEIFVPEMTTARVACGGCRKTEPIGAEYAYMRAPGFVLRCCHCEEVLFVLAQAGSSHFLGIGRARSLEVSESP